MPTKIADRPTTVDNITVLQVGKYGVRVDEKTWYGINEPLTPESFTKDLSYKVSVVTSKTGKKYINEILGQEVTDSAKSAAPATGTPDPVKAAEAALAKAKSDAEAAAKAQAIKDQSPNGPVPVRAGFGQPLTAYDLSIQRQISRAGVMQAALSSPALAQWAVNIDEYLALVKKAADFAFKYVGE